MKSDSNGKKIAIEPGEIIQIFETRPGKYTYVMENKIPRHIRTVRVGAHKKWEKRRVFRFCGNPMLETTTHQAQYRSLRPEFLMEYPERANQDLPIEVQYRLAAVCAVLDGAAVIELVGLERVSNPAEFLLSLREIAEAKAEKAGGGVPAFVIYGADSLTGVTLISDRLFSKELRELNVVF